MIVTRQDTHDLLADLQRIRRQASPTTLRLLRQLEDAYQLMAQHTLVDVHIHVKRNKPVTVRWR